MFQVCVIKGANLSKKGGKQGYYATVYAQIKEKNCRLGKTPIIKSDNPIWDAKCSEPFKIPFHSPSHLLIKIWERVVVSHDNLIGIGTFSFANDPFGQVISLSLQHKTPEICPTIEIRVDSLFSNFPEGQEKETDSFQYIFLKSDPPIEENQIMLSLQYRVQNVPYIFPLRQSQNSNSLSSSYSSGIFDQPNILKSSKGLEYIFPPQKYASNSWTPILGMDLSKFSFSEFYPMINSNGYRGKVTICFVSAPAEKYGKQSHKEPGLYKTDELPPYQPVIFFKSTLDFVTDCSLMGPTFISVKGRPHILRRISMTMDSPLLLENIVSQHGRVISNLDVLTISVSINIWSIGQKGERRMHDLQISALIADVEKEKLIDFCNSENQVCFDDNIVHEFADDKTNNRIMINLHQLPVSVRLIIIHVYTWPKTLISDTRGAWVKVEDSEGYELLYINLDGGNEIKGDGVVGCILLNDDKHGWSILPPCCPTKNNFLVIQNDVYQQISNFLKKSDYISKMRKLLP